MFETSRRRHPLHSFRFWFLILGVATFSVAWKFDLLPVRFGPAESGSFSEQSFTEVDQSGGSSRQDEEPELTVPFIEGDESLTLPTIAPMRAPIRTAAAESTTVPPRQSEYTFSDAAPQDSTPNEAIDQASKATASVFDNWDDDWPTQTASANNTARTEPSSILQTSAVAPAQPTVTDLPLEAPAQPLATASVPNSPSITPSGIDFTDVDALLATGLPTDEIEAHRLLSTIYWQQPEARSALRRRIDALSQNIYFLNSRHYMDAYEVQPGDTLQNIARHYDVPWQYLAKLNRVDPRKVRAGQRLKVIKGPFSAIVDLSEFELTIHAHGYFVTRFSVGIGKDGSSPIGKFAVQEKLVDPTYYGPDGVIDHDDPANPLGERWIDIGDSYGIHGTIDPTSIGKSESRGCIRLHNDDIAAVYDLLTIGSDVTIRP